MRQIQSKERQAKQRAQRGVVQMRQVQPKELQAIK
jgi:hypothetical protein